MEHFIGDTGALRDALPALQGRDISRAHFTSPEALCAYVEAAKSPWDNSCWRDTRVDFRGTRDMGEAIDLCRQGWPQGAAQVARMRDKINAANPVRRKLNAWDIGGAYPSVARALAGNPVHMRSLRDVSRNRTITLIHHMGALATVSGEAMSNKAAVMAAIVDAVEAADFQVELIGVSLVESSMTDGFWHETAFTIKDAGQSVDIGRMAFALGHVAMLRRLIIGARQCDSFNRPLTSSMGSTRDYKAAPDRGYILPSINACADLFANERTASTSGLAFMIDCLRKQGCPAFPQHEAA